jgi:hypothetical protein
MKISPHECLHRILDLEARIGQLNEALRELRTYDPRRGELVVQAARLFADKERLERMLERGGESGTRPNDQ